MRVVGSWAIPVLLLVATILLVPFVAEGQFRRIPPKAQESKPVATRPPAPAARPAPGASATGEAALEAGRADEQDETPPGEADDFVIRQDVRLVRADVQVTQKDRIVSGLSRSDFTLLDEGRQVEITEFGLESDPLDVMLLLDVSGSMTSYLYEVSRAASEAMEQLEPTDRLGVMIFSKEAKQLNELTSQRADIITTLRSLTRLPGMGAGTAINASILQSVEAFATESARGDYDPRRRRAILILTDNWGLNYKAPDRMVLRALHKQSISLHAIVVGRVQKPKGKWGEEPDDELAEQIDFSPANVYRLARETGGDVFTDLKKNQGLPEILGRIRGRYSLYFKPSPEAKAGAFRRITVSLTGPAARTNKNAEVRARAGYYID